MKFSEFILESNKISINKISQEVDEELYIKSGSIYAKRDDSLIISNFLKYPYPELIQKVKDHIDKNFDNEFDIGDRLDFLTYTKNRDLDVDQFIQDHSRVFQEKPLIGFISDDISNHGYIIGYHGKSLQQIVDFIGLPKSGYNIVIFDGKFKAVKSKLKDNIVAYLISPDYEVRKSDGCDELMVGNEVQNIYHIRRKI